MNAAEYQQLFFSTIQRAPGQPADDYEAVLGASGIPAGYGPGVKPDASMPYNAMTQQIGSDGRIAGRIFLPTAEPDPNGYYTHPFSPLRDGETPGSLVWEWRDLGGPPIVTPGASTGDSGGGGLTRDDVQAMIDASLVDVLKVGSRIALRTTGDSNAGIPCSLLSVDGGGPKGNAQPLTFQGRTGDAGPWETLTVEKGQ
jgi:hypothetical protein